jgi:hypothetical protein
VLVLIQTYIAMANIDNAIDQLVAIIEQADITSNIKIGYIDLALTKLANLKSELQIPIRLST